ncbi:MAG: lysylphosphatidylglycerol synthase transmembrane domain-containing protein [Chitinophagales bacterium]
MAKKILTNIFKFGFFLSIGLLLIWLITKDLTEQDRRDISDSFRNANYWWVAISIVVGIVSHIVRALRWQMMIRPLGYETRFRVTFSAVMIAYLSNLAVPRLGEVTRCGIMQRYDKVPFDKALGTIVVERAIDLLSLIIITVFALMFQFKTISGFFDEKVITPLFGKFSFTPVTILIIVVIVAAIYFLFRFAIKKWKHTATYLRIQLLMMNVRDGIYSIRHLKNLPLFIFYTIAMWFCYYSMIWLCFYALPETSNFGINEGLAILVFGTLGIISTPGGIGAYQFIVTELLTSIYMLARPIAYAFSWIVWVGQTLMVILFGFLALILLPLIAREKEMENEAASNTQ